MKINLLYDEPLGCLNGYFNVDPFAGPDDPHGRTAAPPEGLSAFVDASEATELRAMDVLCRLDGPTARKAFDHWLTLIRHGGTLVVGFPSARVVVERFAQDEINLGQFNECLFGPPERPKKVALDAQAVRGWVPPDRFSLVYSRLEGLLWILKFQRG